MKEMNDLISRQAVLALPRNITRNMMGKIVEESIDVELIKALPPVQPKSGEWIDAVIPNDNGDLLVQVCDQCNTFFPLAYTGGGHHFCPNCGADMRGDAE